MDVFLEQIVQKGSSTADTFKKVGISLAALLLSAAIFLFGSAFVGVTLPLLAAFGLFYGAYYLISGMSCEYEYIITNGELDVDKIIAQRKRKRMLTISISAFEDFGKIDDAPDVDKEATVVSAIEPDTSTCCYADFTHPSHGKVRLLFSPNQRMIEGMTPFFSAALKVKMRKNAQ